MIVEYIGTYLYFWFPAKKVRSSEELFTNFEVHLENILKSYATVPLTSWKAEYSLKRCITTSVTPEKNTQITEDVTSEEV